MGMKAMTHAAAMRLISIANLLAACLTGIGLSQGGGKADWDAVRLFDSELAIAEMLVEESSRSRPSKWLIQGILSEQLLASTVATVLVIALVAMVMTEGISNAAVVALMLPLVLPLALPSGGMPAVLAVDPRLLAFPVALPAGLAFTLPISTPPNALAHSTGFVSFGRTGWFAPLMNLICILLFALVALLWWGPAGCGFWGGVN